MHTVYVNKEAVACSVELDEAVRIANDYVKTKGVKPEDIIIEDEITGELYNF